MIQLEKVMTDAISNNNRIKSPNPAAENRSNSAPQKSASSGASSQASAVVELSSDQILGQMERVPEVNASRIESIKNALTNGEYKPDPEVIARKFAEIENLLS